MNGNKNTTYENLGDAIAVLRRMIQGGWRREGWKLGNSRHKLVYTVWMNNKILLYSIGTICIFNNP